MHVRKTSGRRLDKGGGRTHDRFQRRVGRRDNGNELRSTMYHYTESGLRNVWLKSGYEVKKTPYGEAVSIQDVEGLHRLIGTIIARRPKLSGPELRFLRKEMGISQKALAIFVGTSEQNVSLWERRGRIPQAADRIVKLAYLETISKNGNVKIKETIDRLNELDATAFDKLKLEKARVWKEAA